MANKLFLEERLAPLDIQTKNEAICEIKEEKVNPKLHYLKMPYLKDDLVNKIFGYFVERNVSINQNVRKQLYSGSTNKTPLKRVYYGMLKKNCIYRELPTSFLNALYDPEKIYLFAGIWTTNNFNANASNNLAFSHAISSLLVKGIDTLYKHHYIRKAQNEYTRDIMLPYDDKIRQDYKVLTEMLNKRQTEKKQKLICPEKTQLLKYKQQNLF
jgi:hypothetical protein